jgi:predicted  nucleic acid-binding Zn-ribbon protein
MSDATRASVGCTNCGHRFDDYDAANAVDERGARVLPCPDCGDFGRHFSVEITDTATVRETVKFKAKHADGKKPFLEGTGGASYFRATDEWHDVQRAIDRDNDCYDEIVKDADGKVIREVHEPLSQHRGRGSAKRKNGIDPPP